MWEYQKKLLGDNSVVKIGTISLRLVAVIVDNHMQISILHAFSLQKGRILFGTYVENKC